MLVVIVSLCALGLCTQVRLVLLFVVIVYVDTAVILVCRSYRSCNRCLLLLRSVLLLMSLSVSSLMSLFYCSS